MSLNNVNRLSSEILVQNNNNNNCINNNGSSSGGTQKNNNNARRRWQILAQAILKSETTTPTTAAAAAPPPNNSDNSSSNTIYNNIISKNTKECDNNNNSHNNNNNNLKLINHENLIITNKLRENFFGDNNNWYCYAINNKFHVNIHHIVYQPTIKELMGFNCTGNICVWTSEEALTYYVLDNLNCFTNKWILELGGGMTCLAGLIIAKYSDAYCVHLTDGNSLSVDNVKKTTRLNEFNCFIKTSVLKWEYLPSRKLSPEYERYDYILTADCLFFDDSRIALVNAIWFYLAKNGVALVMAPQRGKTFESFIQLALEKGFKCNIIYRYSESIWQKHMEMKKMNYYDENIHYPVLIKLTKFSLS